MKKTIKFSIIGLIVLLGVGTYFGYYGVQRVNINVILQNEIYMECSIEPRKTINTDTMWLVEQECSLFASKYKEAAATSRTYKEFETKIKEIQNANKNEWNKIIEEYKRRMQQREQEK